VALARGVLARADLGVAVLARAPEARDPRGELFVRLTRAQRGLQVRAAGREQTRVQVAVGRQPRAGAVAAERLGDRGDDADLARAVAVAVAARDLAAIARLERLLRELGLRSGPGAAPAPHAIPVSRLCPAPPPAPRL